MSNYKYLPQSIVAYDKKGFDKSTNLIHAATAIPSKDYFCPCCGNVLRVSCLNSKYKQEYYFHKDGECSKETRLHWFCENWLFKKGSQFKVESDLFTVKEISFDQVYITTFGNYSPTLTVCTEEGKEIFFELFFKMNKTETDYFCKWKELNNDVVDIDLDQLQQKQGSDDILEFKYLYHDGTCYSKEYANKDLYLQTIGKMIKSSHTRSQVIEEKINLERLDQFWIFIQTKGFKEEDLLKFMSTMTREEKMVCYDIVSKKQCLKYLKASILNLINEEVKDYLQKQVDLPDNPNVYIDLISYGGRTYEVGIVVKYVSENIFIHEIPYHLVEAYSEHYHIWNNKENYQKFDLKKISGFPKVVFKKQIYDFESVTLNEEQINGFKDMYKLCVDWLDNIQEFITQVQNMDLAQYKISIINNTANVIVKNINNRWQKLSNNITHEYMFEALHESIESGRNEINHVIFMRNYFKSQKFIDKSNDFSDKFHCEVNFNRNDKANYINANKLTFNFNDKGEEIIITKTVPDIYYEEESLDNGVQECFDKALQEYSCAILRQKNIQTLFTQINSCKNRLWFIEGKNDKFFIHLYFRNKKGTIIKDLVSYVNFHYEYGYEDLKKVIYESMKNLVIKAENNGIRILEGKNEG